MASRGLSACVEEWLVGSTVVVIFALLAALAPGARAAPANDDFERAAPLRLGTTVKGTLRGATRERGEDLSHFDIPPISVWYRFTAKRRITVRLSSCGRRRHLDGIGVYTGRSRRSLRELESDSGGCRPSHGSQVVFKARRGRTYRVAAFGFPGSAAFRLKFERVSPPRNDDFADALPIELGASLLATTRNSTREPGEPEYSYGDKTQTVWFHFSSATTIDVRLDACNGSRPDLEVYSGSRVSRLTLVTHGYGCLAQFEAQPGATYHVLAVHGGAATGAFRLSVRDAMPPANDDFAAATPITLGTTISATTIGAGQEPGEPYASSPFTVWFRLTIDATTTFTLDSCGTGDVVFNVYLGDQVDRLVEIAVVSGNACRRTWRTYNAPGVYSIQATDYDEAGFSFSAQALP